MKKTVFTLICTFLACCLLLCGCFSDRPANNESVNGNNDIPVGNTPDVLDAALYDNDIAQLDLLGSSCFYFKGILTDENGESNLMEMAIKDGNSYMGSQMEGVAMGFMNIGADYYMIYPDGQCALLLDETVCSTMGLDPTEMKIDPSTLNFGELNEQYLISTTDALVDTTIATCRTYQQPSGNLVKTYISEGRIIRLQQETPQGVVRLVMDIETLTSNVPADKAGLPSGYKLYSGSVGMMSFMMKLASSMDMDALE